MMFITVGTNCHVKMKRINQVTSYQFGSKELLQEFDFVWPESLMDIDEKKKIPIDIPLQNSSGDTYVLKLTVSRIRELSVYFRRVYLNENV